MELYKSMKPHYPRLRAARCGVGLHSHPSVLRQGAPCPVNVLRPGVWHYGLWRSLACCSGKGDDYIGTGLPPVFNPVQQQTLQELDDKIQRLALLVEAAEKQLSETPDDKALQLQYEECKAVKAWFNELRSELAVTIRFLTIKETYELPAPGIEWAEPAHNPTVTKYPPPSLRLKVWHGADAIIRSEVDSFIARQPQDRVYLPQQLPSGWVSSSEHSVVNEVLRVMSDVQKTLQQSQLKASWAQGPSASQITSSKQGNQAEGAASVPSAPAPAQEVAVKAPAQPTRPVMQLYDEAGVCRGFLEIKTPGVMAKASTISLADLLVAPEKRRKAGGPAAGAEPQFPQDILENILGQVELYCRERQVRYCGLTCYNVTWVFKIQDGSMLISRGFPFNVEHPDTTYRKVLLWLSLKALGPDSMLEPHELPLHLPIMDGSRPSASPSSDSDGPAAGRANPADAQGDAGAPQGGGETGVLQWIKEEPDVPGSGLLGSGITGDVLAGRVGQRPAAVKWAPEGSELVHSLGHEVGVYLALKALQGKVIPELLYYGRMAGGMYALVLSQVFGRQLRGGGLDVHLVPKALESLRAVHEAGYLHGGIRLPNFMVVEEEQGPRVIVLDFGNASPSTSQSDMQAEEAQLTAKLTGARHVLAARQAMVEAMAQW